MELNWTQPICRVMHACYCISSWSRPENEITAPQSRMVVRYKYVHCITTLLIHILFWQSFLELMLQPALNLQPDSLLSHCRLTLACQSTALGMIMGSSIHRAWLSGHPEIKLATVLPNHLASLGPIVAEYTQFCRFVHFEKQNCDTSK